MAGSNPIQSRESFDAFTAAVREALVLAAARIVRDSAEAEDIVQDTLTALWRRWERDPPARPEAYAARAVTLNAIKRASRRKVTLPLEDGAEAAVRPQRAESPLDPMELERALADLPAAQQAVIRLRYYVGLSLLEIGRRLSISSNTAASRCRYALAALRKTLAGGLAPPGSEKENKDEYP